MPQYMYLHFSTRSTHLQTLNLSTLPPPPLALNLILLTIPPPYIIETLVVIAPLDGSLRLGSGNENGIRALRHVPFNTRITQELWAGKNSKEVGSTTPLNPKP